MVDLSKVSVTTTRGRNFIGVVGLLAGYDSTRKPTEDQLIQQRKLVLATWKSWVKERFSVLQPYLGVIVSPVQDLNYSFEEDGKLVFYDEPVVAVHGEIASYQESLSDEQVIEALTSLFSAIGHALMQTTVRFRYEGDNGSRKSHRVRLPETSHPLDAAAK